MSATDYEILLLFSLLLLFSFLYLIVKKGRNDLKGEPGLPSGAEMKPFLFLRLFYVNPDDPRGLLPKTNPSWGWTVNFRNKANAVFFIFLLLCVLVSAVALSAAAIQRP